MENNESCPFVHSGDSRGQSDELDDNKDRIQNEILENENKKLKGKVEEVEKKLNESLLKISDLEKKNDKVESQYRAALTTSEWWKTCARMGNYQAAFAHQDKIKAEEKAATAELKASASEEKATAAELRASAFEERCRDLEAQIANRSRVDRWVAEAGPNVKQTDTFSDTSSVILLESSTQGNNSAYTVHEPDIPEVDLEGVEVATSATQCNITGTSEENTPGGPSTKSKALLVRRSAWHVCKCGQACRSSLQLKNHIKKSIEKKFRCRECKRRFGVCSELRRHQKKVHNNMTLDERKHGCSKCGERFFTAKDRYIHWAQLHAKKIKKEPTEETAGGETSTQLEVDMTQEV
ncbi:unnamed protein product [Orchesella dallaii]|uniref:C2H2-type domain-containing protein n=1 Tax=Orchesella dallaii TaxID=48710 RepID=A0ABP1RIU1_9HEXA